MKIRKATVVSKEEAAALDDGGKRAFEAIPEVEGQELAVLYLECPACHTVSRVTADTDQPVWGMCSKADCGNILRS